jgi:RNA recognition motif-containing protein
LSNLPEEVKDLDIAKHLEKLDSTLKIRNINVIFDYQTFKCKGFAILEFNSYNDGIY